MLQVSLNQPLCIFILSFGTLCFNLRFSKTSVPDANCPFKKSSEWESVTSNGVYPSTSILNPKVVVLHGSAGAEKGKNERNILESLYIDY